MSRQIIRMEKYWRPKKTIKDKWIKYIHVILNVDDIYKNISQRTRTRIRKGKPSFQSLTLDLNFTRLPCYNGGLSNTGTAKHNETVAVTRRRLASVLLRRGGCGTRADGHSEHSILRARGTLTLHQLRLRLRSSTTASVDPMLGGLVGCTSASAEPLHAAQKSAARLQLRRKLHLPWMRY